MVSKNVVLKVHEGAMRLVAAGWAERAAVKASVGVLLGVQDALNKLNVNPRKVTIGVRGGVAEVVNRPDDVEVEIDDYDNEPFR